jgi:hypothetical protein
MFTLPVSVQPHAVTEEPAHRFATLPPSNRPLRTSSSPSVAPCTNTAESSLTTSRISRKPKADRAIAAGGATHQRRARVGLGTGGIRVVGCTEFK